MRNSLRSVTLAGLIGLLSTVALLCGMPVSAAQQQNRDAEIGVVNFKPTEDAIVVTDTTYRVDERTVVVGHYNVRLTLNALEEGMVVYIYRSPNDASYIERIELAR